MESSAVSSYIPQNIKKRLFTGSSASCTEPDVIEITPPLSDRASRMKAKGKQKEVAYHQIIDVDRDEDYSDVVLIEGKREANKKAKRSTGISLGPRSPVKFDSNKVVSDKKGKEITTEPANSINGFNPGSNNFFDLEDYVLDDAHWAFQSHFDNIDLPAGIEAPFPILSDLIHMKKGTPSIPYVSLNAQLEASASQTNGIDPFSTSTWIPPSNYVSNSSSFPHLAMDSSYHLGVDATSKLHDSKNRMELDEAYSSFGMLTGAGGVYSMNDTLSGQDSSATNERGSKRKRSVRDSSHKATLDEDVKKRYESFKQFDTVEDHSDHYYANQKQLMKQIPKNWAKRIQHEWKILEKDLPDTIFVRVYESRMDILRAVIIGAEGTPYHDGLFFFDVFFPSNYPNSPPQVYYRSGGLRINPNLYNCGKVCLSLLNTWSGSSNEKWVPGTSTMLQVLVSIQGLILNMKPYFNEPGYAHSSGSAHGEQSSIRYNENTLILSLRTMVYTMRKPPKNFEDLVIGHFQHRARDILMACKAYTEGVQVGCLVKGGVQDVDESNNSCSSMFKHDVASFSTALVSALKKIGAKEAHDFQPLIVKESSSLLAAAGSAVGPVPPLTLPAHGYAVPAQLAHGYGPYPYKPMSSAYNKHWRKM